MVTFEDIKANNKIDTFIKKGNELLGVLGYTDHSAAHTMKVAVVASEILRELGFDARSIELASIAGYIHDIGNVVNRINHAQTGAIMAFSILNEMGMEPVEIATIIAAIGNHDEGTGEPVNPVAAALVIADKTDVRRSRVRNNNFATFDIHDRVNYAARNGRVVVDVDTREITLGLDIDITICSVMDYFEIFLGRMIMCRRAAEFLKMRFSLVVNGAKLL